MLNELELKQLEKSTEVMWEAMNVLIDKVGYSDLTLYLEGSCYELGGIINKIKSCKENEVKKKTYTGRQKGGKTYGLPNV